MNHERIFPTDRHGNPLGPAREEVVRCRECDNLNIVGKCPCGFFALENLDGFCAWASRGESNARP